MLIYSKAAWCRSSPHPCPQTQDELGSLPLVHQSRDRLSHHEHKLLEFLITHHIILLGQPPHGSREELYWGHQEAKRRKRYAWLWNTSVMARGDLLRASMSYNLLSMQANSSNVMEQIVHCSTQAMFCFVCFFKKRKNNPHTKPNYILQKKI